MTLPTDTPVDAKSLAAAIADAALLHGSFTLRSGRQSSYYLDKYLFSTRPELLGPVGDLLAERIRSVISDTGPIQRLAGAELGGIPLVTVASLRLGIPSLFVRNAKKEYGTAKQTEGALEKGERVIFVEDVTTTAGQAVEAVETLRGLGLEVAAIVTVIDRLEGAADNAAAAGVRFESLFTKRDLGVDD